MASVSKRRWTHNGETKEAWIIRFTDQSGVRRMKTFHRKKEADAFRTKLDTDTAQATPTRMTVREACEAFIRMSEIRMRTGAVGRGYHTAIKSALDCHVIPHLGHIVFSELTPMIVERWMATQQRQGNRGSKPLSNGRLKAVVLHLKQVEEYAIKHGYAARTVVHQGAKEFGKLPSGKIRTFTLDELRQLVEANERGARGRQAREIAKMRCYIQLAAVCGLRLGEISALRPVDLDFERKVIVISRSITQYLEIKGPKTKAGNREVPMSTRVEAGLREWLSYYMLPNGGGLMFTTKTADPITAAVFNLSWRRLRVQAGLQDGKSLRFHALRHLAASVMFEQSIPLPAIARLMGHESFDMTLQVYAHPVRDVAHHLPAFEEMSAHVAAAQRPRKGVPAIAG